MKNRNGWGRWQKIEIQQAGNYRLRKPVNGITLSDFSNPWNFYSLFMKNDKEVNEWLRSEHFLLDDFLCRKCNTVCRIAERKDKSGSQSFSCVKNKNHEYSIFTYSYFSKCHADYRDIFQFIHGYLEKKFFASLCHQFRSRVQKHSSFMGTVCTWNICSVCIW